MQPKIVKRIFIIFIILLPLQYAVVGIVGVMKSEPWPAFVFPAFKSVFSSQENITVDQARFFVENKENDTLTEISPEVIFKGIKKSQLQGFLRSHFSDSLHIATFNDETKMWLNNRLNRQYPSLNSNILQIQWSKEVFHPTAPTVTVDTIKITNQFTLHLSSE